MKYIAFGGAFVTAIVSLIILVLLMVIMISSHASTFTEAIGMLIAIPVACFTITASAWIICDMQKRMRVL